MRKPDSSTHTDTIEMERAARALSIALMVAMAGTGWFAGTVVESVLGALMFLIVLALIVLTWRFDKRRPDVNSFSAFTRLVVWPVPDDRVAIALAWAQVVSFIAMVASALAAIT